MTPGKTSDPNEQAAGSPGEGEPVFLVVGKLRRAHGVRGEMQMEVLTDFPERLRRGMKVYIGSDHQLQVIRTRRQHGDMLLISFQGFPDANSVEGLRNQIVSVRAADLPQLEEGDYYHHQILGLRAIDESGADLGRVTEILETGANDVYVIRPDGGREILLPVTDETILGVDLERGEIRVHLLPGILPED